MFRTSAVALMGAITMTALFAVFVVPSVNEAETVAAEFADTAFAVSFPLASIVAAPETDHVAVTDFDVPSEYAAVQVYMAVFEADTLSGPEIEIDDSVTGILHTPCALAE